MKVEIWQLTQMIWQKTCAQDLQNWSELQKSGRNRISGPTLVTLSSQQALLLTIKITDVIRAHPTCQRTFYKNKKSLLLLKRSCWQNINIKEKLYKD